MFARLLLQSCLYPNLLEGTDRVGGQLHGDKECPFSGITKSGRVWRKVPESSAQSVCVCMCVCGVWVHIYICKFVLIVLVLCFVMGYMLQFGEITK